MLFFYSYMGGSYRKNILSLYGNANELREYTMIVFIMRYQLSQIRITASTGIVRQLKCLMQKMREKYDSRCLDNLTKKKDVNSCKVLKSQEQRFFPYPSRRSLIHHFMILTFKLLNRINLPCFKLIVVSYNSNIKLY